MGRYRDQSSSQQSHITTLRSIVGFQCLVILGLWVGWSHARQAMRVHIPPDIRNGVSLAFDEINPANVYSFASYIFQQTNHWQEDGSKDYPKQLYTLAAYFTPQYLSTLTGEMELRHKNGELLGRTRTIQALPGSAYEQRRVDILDNNSWLVWLDFQITESVRGMDVKNVKIRYPIRVVRFAVDPEKNPWGLALDGYSGDGPRRLTKKDLGTLQTASSNKHKGKL
jgi:integrating conjugative element protein (TIGR03746 family)